MSEHGERRRAHRAISRSEVVVAVLAAFAGLAAIVAATLVDTPAVMAGSDSVAAVGKPSGSTPVRALEPEAGDGGTGAAAGSPEQADGAGPEASRTPSESRSANRQKGSQVNPLVEQVESIVRKAEPATSAFTVATLNILGSNHAGNGLGRAAREAAILRDRGVSLVGLQEVQRDQRGVFISNLPAMQMWPQDALGRDGYRVQIMWRTDRFEMVDSGGSSHTFNSIPSVPIPYVLLRDKKTDARFWVIVTHNSPKGLQSQRNASAEIQIDLVNRLAESGHPVLLMGDMNEKTTYFCKVATRAGMAAANGGSGKGGCSVPGGAQRIDWIFGTEDAVEFSGYVQDSTTVSQGLSDHHLIYADALVADLGS